MIQLNNIISPQLYCHKLSIRFYPIDNIQMEAWFGIVLRNNFLFAAEQIYCDTGMTLRHSLEEISLSESHPYYKQLSGGFPKGYLFDCSDIPYEKKGIVLQKNQIYTIHLVLIGSCTKYYSQIISALRLAFGRGFGIVPIQSIIIDITENSFEGQTKLVYSDNCSFLDTLSHPIYLIDFYTSLKLQLSDLINLELNFQTPVSLIKSRSKQNNKGSYQDKLNGFPSFYQFIRSMCYRLMTLNMLYGNVEADLLDKNYIEKEIEEYISTSTDCILLSANIHYQSLYGTPKKGVSTVYVMNGYKGTLSFGKMAAQYIPILAFGSYLGNGNDINFGLGIFTYQLI